MAELGGRAASGELRTWIAEQMALPPTLHREHYRQRVNPREPGHFLTPAAGMRPVCAAGSRWSRFAFNKADHGSEVEVGTALRLLPRATVIAPRDGKRHVC